jgi:ABC-type multidrug transport system fused ATPase/permease subunit
MSSNVENANMPIEGQATEDTATVENAPAPEPATPEQAADQPVAAEQVADQPVAAEPTPEPEPAPAPLPTITEDMIRTKLDRAHALSDTKELHLAGASNEVAIEFQHVTKKYDLYSNDRGRFLGLFNLKRKRTGYLGTVKANDDLSFRIMKGEAVAFLGLNGAGKSTALKMITGVTHPTSGNIIVNGRVSALLELSAGFDPNLSGRENIHLRGQILGLS